LPCCGAQYAQGGPIGTSCPQPRLNAILLAVFAGVAMMIAAIGIYGVLAYSVNLRTREIGLRMTLGAPREQVVRLIVREGMTVITVRRVDGREVRGSGTKGRLFECPAPR